MSETTTRPTTDHPEIEIARERTKQARIIGWRVGFIVFFAVSALATNPTWPAAVGVAALAAMVSFVCYKTFK